jgi:hypothetical protein
MIRLYFVPLVFLGVAHAVIAGPDQQERAIDTQRSSVTVHGSRQVVAPECDSADIPQRVRLLPVVAANFQNVN